ncbi:MAG: dihydrodipicolinate synthase family protein [Deltaproteobacteria bacterium]|nr:dihydrodipicolinate synthase family protein [Deltaproteobacteria bacterium]
MSALASAYSRLVPRTIHGIAAVLLPYTADGAIDWASFEAHVERTRSAGLDVAVNMDTGFGDLLSEREREAVLDAARRTLGSGRRFYAGAFGGAVDVVGGYHAAMRAIEARGGVPVIVQHRAMHGLPAAEKAALYARISDGAAQAVGFELGPMFAAHGEIWDDETFARLLDRPRLVGATHPSLKRGNALRRRAARDRRRPEFRVYTGNDLAIDMVAYGSDYLLGLATFAPAAFAARDRAFAAGGLDFLARNDALQHLGNVGFRAPVPAYKHAAAMFLHLTGALRSDAIHPRAPRRPASDRILLLDCAVRLGAVEDAEAVYKEKVAPYL